MKAFVQAFGGLIGVALIGIAFVAALMLVDWIMVKLQQPKDTQDDEAPR